MGQHVCSHLINTGYLVTVFNRTLSGCDALSNISATVALSPREVALNPEIIFTNVEYPQDVKSKRIDPNNDILSGDMYSPL